MKRAALFLLVAFVADAGGRFDRVNTRCAGGRSSRGLSCTDYAFFEFAPLGGAGMTAACACTTPTGAKGEAMTFTRTGAATCSKQGLATTGINDGDLVTCASDNQPRVEPSGGVLGLRVESAKTNPLLRFIDYANATWADVATPTLTGSQASPWTGTYATSAVQFDDNNAGAFEGRSQTVTVTAATQYTMCCYVKAGTLAKVRLSLDGTTADHTELSSSTWSLVSVTDASSSGVAISAQVLNGTATTDTGTVTWGGCGIETGAFCSSMIPTVAASATRNADRGYLALASTPKGADGIYSMSATVATLSDVSRNWEVAVLNAGGVAPYVSLYSAGVNDRCESFNGTSLAATTAATGPSGRWTCWNDGATEQGIRNGTAFTSPVAGTRSGVGLNRIYVATASAGYEIEGIITNVCADPSPTRCR